MRLPKQQAVVTSIQEPVWMSIGEVEMTKDRFYVLGNSFPVSDCWFRAEPNSDENSGRMFVDVGKDKSYQISWGLKEWKETQERASRQKTGSK